MRRYSIRPYDDYKSWGDFDTIEEARKERSKLALSFFSRSVVIFIYKIMKKSKRLKIGDFITIGDVTYTLVDGYITCTDCQVYHLCDDGDLSEQLFDCSITHLNKI